jgi:hypothetical protein
VTIYGQGFNKHKVTDLTCIFGSSVVEALVIDDETIKCKTPSHFPDMVNVSLALDGSLLHRPQDSLNFLFTPDASVEKVTPNFGYTAGGYPVFIFGSNFLPASSRNREAHFPGCFTQRSQTTKRYVGAQLRMLHGTAARHLHAYTRNAHPRTAMKKQEEVIFGKK